MSETKVCQICGSDAKFMKGSKTHCNCSNKDCLLSGDKYFHVDKWNKRSASSVECVGEQINLLPCPFCGGKATLISHDNVGCYDKFCPLWANFTIEAWNTRPAASVPSEIEIMAAINKAGFDLGSVKGLDIARQIHALLTERK